MKIKAEFRQRINNQIKTQKVRVTKDGQNLGVMETKQALALAEYEGLDLVEIVPKANPPVCSLMDYGKFKFEQKKKDKKQKQSNLKEIRLRPVSENHDVEIKIQQIRKFLLEKKNIIVKIRFKPRELNNKFSGLEIINKIMKSLETESKVDNQPKFEGNTLILKLSPK